MSNKKTGTDYKISEKLAAASARIGVLSERITILESKLKTTQKLVKQDMEKLIDLVKEKDQ